MSNPVQEQQIAQRATIVSFGNVLSRIMGLVREMTVANIFGAGGAVSAFHVAFLESPPVLEPLPQPFLEPHVLPPLLTCRSWAV